MDYSNILLHMLTEVGINNSFLLQYKLFGLVCGILRLHEALVFSASEPTGRLAGFVSFWTNDILLMGASDVAVIHEFAYEL